MKKRMFGKRTNQRKIRSKAATAALVMCGIMSIGLLCAFTGRSTASAMSPAGSTGLLPAQGKVRKIPVKVTGKTSQKSTRPGLVDLKIAFASRRDGNMEIYTMNLDGSGVKRLTTNPEVDTYPVFSPDGTKIAFASLRNASLGIFIMSSDGSGQTRVTTTRSASKPAFSPDGKKIVFGDYYSDQTKRQIYILNLSDGSRTRITNALGTSHSNPVFSPDGKKIALSMGSPYVNSSYIYTMNIDGSGKTCLTPAGNEAGHHVKKPAFSPDGKKIAYTFQQGGHEPGSPAGWKIYIMNSDGSDQTRLTTNDDESPVFNRYGNKIAYFSDLDQNHEIFIMNTDGSGQTRLTNNPAADVYPCFGLIPRPTVVRPDIRSDRKIDTMPPKIDSKKILKPGPK